MANEATATTTDFAAGQTVDTGAGDYVWTFDVLKRTAKFVTLRDQLSGDTYRVGIKRSDFDGVEYALPFGRYSMAPIVKPAR